MSSLTRADAERLGVLIYNRDHAGLGDFMDEHDPSPFYLVTFLAGVAADLASLLMKGDDPCEGMFILEQPGAAFGSATAPPALQLVNAYANEDLDMADALTAVILASIETFHDALSVLLGMTADLMHLVQDAS